MATDAPGDGVLHEPSREFVEATNVWQFMQAFDIEDYEELIERTTGELDWFWDTIVDYLGLDFYSDYDQVRDPSAGPQFTEWYVGGTLNVAHNTVDRHADPESGTRNHVACLWEGEPGDVRQVTYHDLHREANQVANALAARDVEKGDTVALYMPMVPEVISILYGIFKVGAIAVPIFSGFGTDAVATRLEDADASVLFTGDGFYRRGEPVRLKRTADEAIEATGAVEHTIVFDRLGSKDATGKHGVSWEWGRDEWWEEAVLSSAATYETTEMESGDPAMLLYSSGTTGKPKGIIQAHAGTLVQPAKEIYFGFDHQPADRFFWVSDIGWMMGPWALVGNHVFGGTVVMYEGAPDHPEPDRFWDLIERHGVTTFGISPTAIRALRKHGDEWVQSHDLSSIRLLGSTGEPWDEDSWEWFYQKVGGGEAPIINISGGTEIFGCFLMPMPIQSLKPTTLGGPGLGMDVDIVDIDGESVKDQHERGYLVARSSCPSMTKGLWDGEGRYIQEYWSTWDDRWDHGDWAQKDEDGFWYLHGRADDAINVSGMKVGPAEVEAVLIDHSHVNQAAAVGVPDETTGQAVVAFVILEPGTEEGEELREELGRLVADELGKPFRPREIKFADAFPKTQSGKIVRRAIESAYTGEGIGDTSSIENPEVIERLREES